MKDNGGSPARGRICCSQNRRPGFEHGGDARLGHRDGLLLHGLQTIPNVTSRKAMCTMLVQVLASCLTIMQNIKDSPNGESCRDQQMVGTVFCQAKQSARPELGPVFPPQQPVTTSSKRPAHCTAVLALDGDVISEEFLSI